MCFENGAQKNNYREEEPGKHLDVYSNIWAKPKRGRKNWVIAFGTWTSSWVGRTEAWYGDNWHAWGSAIIGEKRRKLIIFDCDPKEFEPGYSPKPKELAVQKQRNWIEYARQKTVIEEAWYNTDSSEGVKDECVAATMRWIERISSKSNEELWGTNWASIGYIQLRI